MAGETLITYQGNLVDDPELRFTPAGHAVAKFRMASTPRTFDKSTNEWRDGETLFLTVNAWRKLAENLTESLKRGDRVIVRGALKQRSYEDREGVKRTVYEIEAEDVGPSLQRATAVVTKANSQQRQQNSSGYGAQQNGGYGQSDPWANGNSAAGQYGAPINEPPF